MFLSSRLRTRSGSRTGDATRIIRQSGLQYASYLAAGTLGFELASFSAPLPTAHKIAQDNRIPLLSHPDINQPKALNWVRDSGPDLLLSGFFNQKLRADALGTASQGSVNLHPSLLPKYKGVDPVFYCALNGEHTLGISLHQMDQNYDTGLILAQDSLSWNPSRSVFWHTTELFRMGGQLFLNWLREPARFETRNNTPISDHYDSWPTPHQVRQLRAEKIALWNWRDFREQVYRCP